MLLVAAKKLGTFLRVELHATNNRKQVSLLVLRKQTRETMLATLFDGVNYGTDTRLTELVHSILRNVLGVRTFQGKVWHVTDADA
jgi:hypothetical protein